MRKPAAQSRWISYGYMLLVTVIWSAAFVIVKPAYEIFTPFRFLLYRYLIAVICSLPILAYYWRKHPLDWQQLLKVIVLEVLGTTLVIGFVYSGLQYTTTITANLLVTPIPVVTTMFGLWLLKEKQELNEWIGLALSFGGALLLAFYPLLQSSSASTTTNSVSGTVLILLHVLTVSLYYPLAKKYYRNIPKLLVTSISFYVGLLSFLVLSLLELNFSWSTLLQTAQYELTYPAVLLASGYMAVLGSIVGYTAYIKGQDGIEASEASLFGYLSPVIALPLGMIVLNEKLEPYQMLILPIILAGVFIAEKRFKRRQSVTDRKIRSLVKKR